MISDYHFHRRVDGFNHSKSQQFHPSVIFSLFLDGIGLAIIAGCTILEGIDLWNDFYNEYWEENSSSLGFWFSGRILQVTGIILLILHAASLQLMHEMEVSGMLMLTIGRVYSCKFRPGINCVASKDHFST